MFPPAVYSLYATLYTKRTVHKTYTEYVTLSELNKIYDVLIRDFNKHKELLKNARAFFSTVPFVRNTVHKLYRIQHIHRVRDRKRTDKNYDDLIRDFYAQYDTNFNPNANFYISLSFALF